MFLFRGADRTIETIADNVEATNKLILDHRRDFDKDVEVLAKLCEGVLGPSSCTPNLHSLHHMIRKLVDLKGHPTFEMIVERLVSKPYPFTCYTIIVTVLALCSVYVVIAAYCPCCC